MRIVLRWIDEKSNNIQAIDATGDLHGLALELVTDDGTSKRLVVAEGLCSHMADDPPYGAESHPEGT